MVEILQHCSKQKLDDDGPTIGNYQKEDRPIQAISLSAPQECKDGETGEIYSRQEGTELENALESKQMVLSSENTSDRLAQNNLAITCSDASDIQEVPKWL